MEETSHDRPLTIDRSTRIIHMKKLCFPRFGALNMSPYGESVGIAITDALELLGKRAVLDPERVLLEALRHGQLIACGFVAEHQRPNKRRERAAWRQLVLQWWR